MIIWIAPVLGFLRSALPYALLFLRSIPEFFAPKPTSADSTYVPPFTGGQCVGIQYRVNAVADLFTISDGVTYPNFVAGEVNANGKILGVAVGVSGNGGTFFNLLTSGGVVGIQGTNNNDHRYRNPRILSIVRSDGAVDTCGNLTDPNPPSIADDGLFNPVNPNIGDNNGTLNPGAIVLAPAAPLVLVPLISSAIAAALAAARAAGTALDAIQKVAEALEGLGKLWDKLKEFLEDWEKNRPKKRDIVRQTYGQILGDGSIDFFPNNNTKFQAIQLDVVITSIPIGYGRYFGNLSPSRYRFRELGYIAFYSTNQGILETHSIQFKRTSYQIPELAVGFIYHLGLDGQIKGYAFGTFSVEKT